MSRDDDLLERATRALRATPPPTHGELAQAKARMLAAQRATVKSNRARQLRWVLPLAAVLAAGSALAAVPNGIERLAAVVHEIITPKPVQKAKPKVVKPAPAPVVEAAPQPVPEPVAERPIEQPPQPIVTKSERPRKREPMVMPAPTVMPEPTPAPQPAVVEPVAPAAIASADLAKYRAAHKAHFQQRDFALALHNWESYLRQYPSGTFAIEARYNRAICLLRLNRKDEARRALAPFARGELGNGYRQAEATKLLEALE